MKIQKILYTFARLANAKLVIFCQSVITALKTNPNVPTPQPDIPALQAALDDLTAAISAALAGGKEQREIRKTKRLALIELLKQEAAYVSVVCNGDIAKILSTGFDVSKLPQPIGPLPKPEKFRVQATQKGMLKCSLKKIKGAKNYVFDYKLAGADTWESVMSTKTRITLTGLESGKEYVARVLPIGVSEERTYSDEITSFVL
jgi:hypothetical protein